MTVVEVFSIHRVSAATTRSPMKIRFPPSIITVTTNKQRVQAMVYIDTVAAVMMNETNDSCVSEESGVVGVKYI